jgi:hypothetical protein
LFLLLSPTSTPRSFSAALTLTLNFIRYQSLKGKDSKSGMFVVRFHPEWAPVGVARVRELVDSKFFKDVRFFRVLSNFMAQFGISGSPVIVTCPPAHDTRVAPQWTAH